MFFFKKLQRHSFCSHFLEQNDQKLSTISTFCGFVKKYPKPSCSFVGFDYLCQSKGHYKGDRHQPQFNNHLIMKAIRTFLFLAISAVLICCANTSAKKTDATAENAGAPSVSASVAENTPTDVRGLGLVGNVKEVSVTVREISPEPGEPYVDSTQVMRFDENGRVLKDRYDNLYKYDDKGNFIFGLSEKTKMRRDEKGRIVYYENRMDEEDGRPWMRPSPIPETTSIPTVSTQNRKMRATIIPWLSTIHIRNSTIRETGRSGRSTL